MKKPSACFILLILILTSFQIQAQEIQEEKVFVHLNKTLAIVGETIWFNLSLHQPGKESISNIAYGELINREGNPAYQVIFALEDGNLRGHIDLPKDLPTDHYLLRFYTRISPKLGMDGIHNQFITIINPQKPFRNPQNPISVSLPFSIQKPQLKEDLISEKSISKKEIINLNPADLEHKKVQVSAAIQNPFLPKNLKGRFNGQIYQPDFDSHTWIPEPYGHVVQGKNLDTAVDTTETFYLSAHGKQSVLNTAKPKSNGDLFFDLGPLKSYDYFIIQSSNWEDQLNFSIQSPFWNLKFREGFVFPAFQINENDKSLIMDLILAAQVSPYFYASNEQPFQPIVTGFVADKTYYLDDYNRFEKTETVLREYVPEVAVRKQDKKTLFKLLNNPIGSIFDQNPLLLVDAMPVFDTDLLANLNPKNIQKLEVVSREFYLNQDKFAGVLSFSSYKNDFGGFPIPATALYLNYPKIQTTKTSQSPHFNANLSEENYPDFRTALFWSNKDTRQSINPGIFTSHISGNFELLISFINEKGEFELYKDEFEIVD